MILALERNQRFFHLLTRLLTQVLYCLILKEDLCLFLTFQIEEFPIFCSLIHLSLVCLIQHGMSMMANFRRRN